MKDIELIREAAQMLEIGNWRGTPNKLRALADRLEAQSKAKPVAVIGFGRTLVDALRVLPDGTKLYTHPASDEVERFKALCVRNLLQDNARITSLEAHLSAIRQAVEKASQHVTVVIGDYASATMYEQHWLAILDAINPAPVVNQQLTTAPAQGENNG